MSKVAKMTKNCAKWYLTADAYDAFVNPHTGKMDKLHTQMYDSIVQLSLLCLLDEPVYGLRIHKGNEDCWKILFTAGDIWHVAYFKAGKDFKMVKVK